MKFSIIIALAPDRDAEVLSSLNKIDYPKKDYEIIIKKGLNPSENRNAGIKEAKGEILAFIDDDAILHKNILNNVTYRFGKHPEVDIIGGPQLTPRDDKFFAKISGYVLASFLGTHQMRDRYRRSKFKLPADEMSLTSANLFVKKKAIKRIGLFDPSLYPGEDPEFLARAESKGARIAYDPNVVIYHRRRPTWYLFCKQFFKYGHVRMKKEKLRGTLPQLVFYLPSLFTLYIILVGFLSYFIHSIFLYPLYFYGVIVILNSLLIGLRKNFIATFILPFIFLSIHFSYGLGMLWYFFKK